MTALTICNDFRAQENKVLQGSKERSFGLKLNIRKTKIMAPGPITLWQIDGETMETVRDFILGALKSL